MYPSILDLKGDACLQRYTSSLCLASLAARQAYLML